MCRIPRHIAKTSIVHLVNPTPPDLAQALPEIFVRDVELDIKYLMGRNYHRGQDVDLGPYEASGI